MTPTIVLLSTRQERLFDVLYVKAEQAFLSANKTGGTSLSRDLSPNEMESGFRPQP